MRELTTLLTGITRGHRRPLGPVVMVCVVTLLLATIAERGMATEYRVGPNQALAEVEEVPWESLEPGDSVLIHARPQPYRAKWVICRRGTPEQPILVRGVPSADGTLPVIDGRDAVTRRELNYWGEARGVIKVGGANRPEDTVPARIVIENLDIRSGRQPYRFTGRDGKTDYLKNAAAIFIEKGQRILIRGCHLHDSGNGLFCSPQAEQIRVEGCRIFDNGVEGSIYEHNSYTSARGITFQFNHFGPLRDGCPGNNLKDRSASLVVRYNWIDGGNRALDLVDGPFGQADGYRDTFVYGNVLIKRDTRGNNQVVHYGGDSDDRDRYRQGTLHFFHNTVVSCRSGTTTLFRLSSGDERVIGRNNIFYVTGPGRRLAILAEAGRVELQDNWIKSDWRESHSSFSGSVAVTGRLHGGDSPGFADADAEDFRLAPDSPCIAAGSPLTDAQVSEHRPRYQYIRHARGGQRPRGDRPDLGAFGPAP